MTERITIHDIAERANVSKSTVSRVLNGTAAVNEEKRTAVLAAISELNYQPNMFARGLAGGQSMTIGVVTQNVGSAFYDAILQGVVRGLRGSGYSPIFADGLWQPDVEKAAMQTLLDRMVDGLIMVGGYSPYETFHTFREKCPVVVVARHLPPMVQDCLYVENFPAAYALTQHLIRLGHRNIAHISGIPEQEDSIQRLAGYKQALEDANITPNPDLIVEGDFRPQAGVMGVELLLTRGQTFSAIFAANDQMAQGARLNLFRRGLRVPDDVSLVGFDDERASAYMTPPLTTVRQPGAKMGEDAAKLILSRLKGNTTSHIEPFPAKLVLRESVARIY